MTTPSPDTGSKDFPIRSISRAIAVLQSINRHGSLSITQVSRAAQIPYATASRIIQSLVHEGVLEREPHRKRYRPTPLSLSLSCGYRASNRLINVARPHIELLTKETGWPVVLSTRVGGNMVLQDSTHELTTQTFTEYYPGLSLPMSCSVTGHAVLAFSDQVLRDEVRQQQADLIAQQNSPFGPDYMSEGYFADIRDRGYSVKNFSQLTPNSGTAGSIALPVFEGDKVAGALEVIFFATSVTANKLLARYGDIIWQVQAAIGTDLLEDAGHSPEETARLAEARKRDLEGDAAVSG